MRHRSFSYRGKAWWLSIMTPNFDAIPLERAVCAWCSRCVASVCFRIEGEVHPAATLVTGWGRTTLGRGKHRASGQRDAIHDRSVFGAQLTFDRPTSSSGSQHRQRVVHHTFQGHDSGCPQCSRSIRLSRSASSAFRTPSRQGITYHCGEITLMCKCITYCGPCGFRSAAGHCQFDNQHGSPQPWMCIASNLRFS